MGVLSTPWPQLLGLVWFDFPSQSFSGEIHAAVIILTAEHWIQMWCMEPGPGSSIRSDAAAPAQTGNLGARFSLSFAAVHGTEPCRELLSPHCLEVFCVRRSCLFPAGNLPATGLNSRVQGWDFAPNPVCHITQALQVLLLF